MSKVATEDGTAARVFKIFSETLEGERDELDIVLSRKLKWFAEDVARAIQRIAEDPRIAPAVVLGLSSTMQQLDHDSGAVGMAHENVQAAKKAALTLPATAAAVHEG